ADWNAGFFGYERRLTLADLNSGKLLWQQRDHAAPALTAMWASSRSGSLQVLAILPLRAATAAKGSSNLLAVAGTTSENGPWSAGGPPTVRGLDPGRSSYLGPGRQLGGLHAGGANFSFADGSARFLTKEIDRRVLESLATTGGDQLGGSDW